MVVACEGFELGSGVLGPLVGLGVGSAVLEVGFGTSKVVDVGPVDVPGEDDG